LEERNAIIIDVLWGTAMNTFPSLTATLPKVPDEAQSWIYRGAVEDILNKVGADSFVESWQTHSSG